MVLSGMSHSLQTCSTDADAAAYPATSVLKAHRRWLTEQEQVSNSEEIVPRFWIPHDVASWVEKLFPTGNKFFKKLSMSSSYKNIIGR